MGVSDTLYEARSVPVLQNVIYPDPDSAKSARTGDIVLRQCPATGLVFNAAFDPSAIGYDASYQNEQACSPTFQAHLDATLDSLAEHFYGLSDGVEIGCGKGHFLEMARSRGLRLTGFDPAYEGSAGHVVRENYRPDDRHGERDFFVLRHVLEHIPEPWDFLATISAGAKESALIYIEVPAFEWILEHRALYDIFYEHCNYFTLDVLSAGFSEIVAEGYCFGGQYLQLIARLGSFETPRGIPGEPLGRLAFADMAADVAARLRNDRSNFIWGAGAKGVTMANLLHNLDVPIDALIDINPAKQGGYISRSAIPVLSPESAGRRLQGANVLIMNPNYSEEIRRSLSDRDVMTMEIV